MTDYSFEVLRAELEALEAPEGQTRNLTWLKTPLGVGRTATGDYEVFIRGSELQSNSSLVRRHVQHSEWQPVHGGEVFLANRIVLPPAPHFASVAALIAIELLRAGIDGPPGPQAAFYDVEPIIEMAIRRGALPENVIVGLIGELTVLRQLTLSVKGDPRRALRCLDLWQGWQDGGRDFRIGRHSIEVKATQNASSIHQFSGLHQLEAVPLPSGQPECLHLMSIGLVASNSIGESLPSLVSGIIALLTSATGSAEAAQEFTRRIALYGGQSGGNYVHESMAHWNVYSTRYAHTFPPRLYRIDDPAMLLLTREALAQTFVQPEGLSFSLHIPHQVSPFNPASNWEGELASMTASVMAL